MKKAISLLLCLLLTAALAVPALADVIWEPNDDFYFAHFDECRASNESYPAAADTTVYADPETPVSVGVIPAGENVPTPYIWTDKNGDEWGYVEYYDASDAGWIQGWVDLTDPAAAPASFFQSTAVLLVVAALAVTAACIMLLGKKWV